MKEKSKTIAIIFLALFAYLLLLKKPKIVETHSTDIKYSTVVEEKIVEKLSVKVVVD